MNNRIVARHGAFTTATANAEYFLAPRYGNGVPKGCQPDLYANRISTATMRAKPPRPYLLLCAAPHRLA
jgi:hypothetical protein